MVGGYENIRTAVLASGEDARVEVNQRALIDKILARYASAGAVYRELLQNSNDAEATNAEVHFKTSGGPKNPTVSQVVYKNDGLPFRSQDWSRLRKIAEGNPDVAKVGAFGVGAYTMFSICEEPMVVSGGQAMAFSWRGDSLWVKLGKTPDEPDKWTSFVLQSRDPYPLPDLVELGQFLCSSLTFTACLKSVSVFVDGVKRLIISKRETQAPRIIALPKASSWWRGDGAVTKSPKGVFSLGRSDGSITETMMEISVEMDGGVSKKRARYVSAVAETHVPSSMVRRMERVTKKRPPPEVKIEVFIDVGSSPDNTPDNPSDNSRNSAAIVDSFSPNMGAGRVFIGFRTSQTTGLAAHLAAPFLPTVEREAIDFQELTLRIYNSELLSIAGILMRLTLEHSMWLVGEQYALKEPERIAYEDARRRKDPEQECEKQRKTPNSEPDDAPTLTVEDKVSNSIMNFAKFMSSGMKRIAHAISSADFIRDNAADVLRPEDSRPLSKEEEDGILLMRSFSPQPSTPDAQVGALLARGFEMCLPGLSPPVLTSSGMIRGSDSRLPFQGIEGFVKSGVVRSVVFENAEKYLIHVAGCRRLSLQDLMTHFKSNPIDQDDFLQLLKWWAKYFRVVRKEKQFPELKESILLSPNKTVEGKAFNDSEGVVPLSQFVYYVEKSMLSQEMPMPSSVLPKHLLEKTASMIMDRSLLSWFSELSLEAWLEFIADQPCMTDGQAQDSDVRLRVLVFLSGKYAMLYGDRKKHFSSLLCQRLSAVRCIPTQASSSANLGSQTDFPSDLYLLSADLDIFNGSCSLRTVSKDLDVAGVSEDFLVALGVRKTVSIDFLFTQLDRLKWNRNPEALIRFLRNANLTGEDLEKLSSTQYLPEVNDKARPYAPFELSLPNCDLHGCPFVKMLEWPSYPLSETSPDAEFLKKLGCHVDPPLNVLITYLSSDIKKQAMRPRVIDFLYKKLGPGGPYVREYANFLGRKFLLATIDDPFQIKQRRVQLLGPKGCYSDSDCSCLGFPILDSSVPRGMRREYQETFHCATEPPVDHLVSKLLFLVDEAKRMQTDQMGNSQVLIAFERIFAYLSSRCTELNQALIDKLCNIHFIPQNDSGSLKWYRPNSMFFKGTLGESDNVISELFCVRGFNPFLATVGVKSEPSTEDIFRLLLSSPHEVLEKVGSDAKYCSLLRRIATNPPYRRVTQEMKNSSFLLGFVLDNNHKPALDGSAEEAIVQRVPKYTLAKAGDICIIDNSHYSRMFNVLAAPQELELEQFYKSIGSTLLSEKVDRRIFVPSVQRQRTELCKTFQDRVKQRRPLLLSSLRARQMTPEATALLLDDHLQIYEVASIKAKYSLGQQQKDETITCAAVCESRAKTKVFITSGLDWFHVGNALGNIILKRCGVQDAFFIGSLLEASLSQLRARGFPVDRVMRGGRPSSEHGPNEPQQPTYVPPKPDQSLHIEDHERKQATPQSEENISPKTETRRHVSVFRNFRKEKPNIGDSGQLDVRDDVSQHKLLEDTLRELVKSARSVPTNIGGDGVVDVDNTLTEAEESFSCKLNSDQSLIHFAGPRRSGRTKSGMRVFSLAESNTVAVRFLEANWKAVESFSDVLKSLCSVLSLQVDTVGIFYQPTGSLIAFTSKRYLYCNLRYFVNLHYQPGLSPRFQCYAYWYAALCHELAHFKASSHGVTHVLYTQSYMHTYLPQLFSTLRRAKVAGL